MTNILEEHVPEHDSDNYCATLEWIRQQVRVRFPDIGIGIAGITIELTKERAWILRDMIKIMEDYVPEGDLHHLIDLKNYPNIQDIAYLMLG